jgi:hypothetical protein
MVTTTATPEIAAKPDFINVPLRVPRDLDDRLKAASDETHVSKQDLMRLSIERGLESLLAALTGKAA